MDEPLSEPPAEEGDDQEAAEGAEIETPTTDDDLEDAPATEDVPDVPEESVA